jgi:hypothetical protein
MNELFIFDELFMGGDVIYIAEADIQAPSLYYTHLNRPDGVWIPSSYMNFSDLLYGPTNILDRFGAKDYPLDITG